MKRLFVILLFALLIVSSGADKVLIWEASAPGYAGKAYLTGSIHVGKKSWYPLDRTYDLTLKNCDAVYFEIYRPNEMEAAQATLLYGMFKGTGKLSDVLGYQDFQTVCTFFQKQSPQMMVPAVLEKLRPWMLYMLVAQTYLQKHPEYSRNCGVEKVLTAHLGSKPGHSLESIQSQIAVISGISDQASGRILMEAVREFAKAGQELAGMEKSLLSGDISTIASQTTEVSFKHPVFYREMFTKRNHAIVQKLLPELKKKQVLFVVVGAGHFGGPDNILELFQKNGFTIRQLKKTGKAGKLVPVMQ